MASRPVKNPDVHQLRLVLGFGSNPGPHHPGLVAAANSFGKL